MNTTRLGLFVEYIGASIMTLGVYYLGGLGWALLFVGLFIALEGGLMQ